MLLLQRLIDRLAKAVAQRINVAPGPSTRNGVPGNVAPQSGVQRFIDQLEWEPGSKGVEGAVTRVGGQFGDYGTLTIRRDAEYRLEASLVANGGTAFPNAVGRSGSIDDGVELAGEDERGFPFVLPRVILSTSLERWEGEASTITLGLAIHRLTRQNPIAQTPTLMVDWFISGPEQMPFRVRGTARTRSEAYSRERSGFGFDSIEHREATEPPPVGTMREMSRDYFVLELPTGHVRVCRVPKAQAPQWTRPMAIEYSIGEVPPSKELRDSIVEALGFVFGRHILRVGTTTFSDDGRPVEEVANSPWGRDVIQVCTRVDVSAIPSLESLEGAEVERILSSIVSSFLASRDEMNLGRAVWTLWIGQRMPATFDSPLYASALEALMQGWFKSKRSKSGGVYMPYKEFRKAFDGPLKDFAAIAKRLPYGDRMTRKVDRANAMGVNERFEVFFEELGMPYGDGELDIIQARNIAAHGGVSDRSKQEILFLGNGYRTLVNRVILTMIAYKGQYVDYSVMGHPSRRMDEPIGYRAAQT